MYDWRKMSDEERKKVLSRRKYFNLPWHRPPRFKEEGEYQFFISATCYEHKPVIGSTIERLLECEDAILSISEKICTDVYAWCVMPNHYHLLLQTDNIKELLHELGRFHGRSSRKWNLEDNQIGRKVWFNYFERPVFFESQFWAIMNYIHHNPVQHDYVEHWTDWQFSSAMRFVSQVGEIKAAKIWRTYPFAEYADKWD